MQHDSTTSVMATDDQMYFRTGASATARQS